MEAKSKKRRLVSPLFAPMFFYIFYRNGRKRKDGRAEPGGRVEATITKRQFALSLLFCIFLYSLGRTNGIRHGFSFSRIKKKVKRKGNTKKRSAKNKGIFSWGCIYIIYIILFIICIGKRKEKKRDGGL